MVGEEADVATWEGMRALFTSSVEEGQRSRLLWSLSLARDPALVARSRELVLDPVLRDNEIMTPLWAQLEPIETREQTWAWLKAHDAAVLARLPKHHGGVQLIYTANVFCDEAHAADAEAFFKPKLADIEGGPRALALALENVRLCAAKRKAQEPHMRAYFSKR
jgi:alanyl aminopeptidase